MSEFVCRACDGHRSTTLLDMGSVPLANAFVGPAAPDVDQTLKPLALVICDECSTVQIRDFLSAEELFKEILWVSGTSTATREYAASFAAKLREHHLGKSGDFLVEIASNDGLLLDMCQREGFRVLGVDPSNVADEANSRGIRTTRAFFGCEVAERIVRTDGQADVIVARHAIGHTPDLRDLLGGIQLLMKRGGTCVIESPYALFLRDQLQYDTIFHEHVCYWTITSLQTALRRFDLEMTRASFVPMNGGSFVVTVKHRRDATPSNIDAILALENVSRINEAGGWTMFSARVEAQRQALRSLLHSLTGSTVVAYGAAAKFMTILNYCGITSEMVRLVADVNPRKQGLLCPGVRIPVVSPQRLLEENPDYVLIGAWNLQEEIINYCRSTLGYRHRFIVPVPVPAIL